MIQTFRSNHSPKAMCVAMNHVINHMCAREFVHVCTWVCARVRTQARETLRYTHLNKDNFVRHTYTGSETITMVRYKRYIMNWWRFI